MNRTKLSGSFMDRVSQRKVEAGVTDRSDLSLEEYKAHDDLSASLLLSYAPNTQAPSNQEIKAWVDSKFGNMEVNAHFETVRMFPEKNAVMIAVSRRVERRPIDAADQMIRAGMDAYQDEHNVIWNVARNDHGSFLVRKEGEPIDRMIEIRKAALKGQRNARGSVRFATVMDSIPSAGGGFARVEKGDLVDFFDRGLIHRGRVTSSSGKSVAIKIAGGPQDGKTMSVDPAAITSIREKAPQSEQREDDVMRDYYSLIYPGNPDMTKAISPLSRKSVKDPRPGPGGQKVENIKTVASVSASSDTSKKKSFVRRVKG